MSCISPAHAQAKFRGGYSFEQFRGSLLEYSTVCKSCAPRNRLRSRSSDNISGEWQRPVLGGKNGYATVCHPRETVDLRLQSAEVEYIWGLGWPLSRSITLVVVPHRKNYRLFTRFDPKYSSKWALSRGLGKWRREFCEVAQERCTGFNSLNASANFVWYPLKQGCRTGKPKLEVRGQQDALKAVTLSSNGTAMPLELDGARRVKVIGVGAGASAVLNFCQQSSLLPSAQFWYSSHAASDNVLLSEHVRDSNLTDYGVEGNKDPLITQDSNEEIVFLVLGVGSGTALGFIPGQLRAVRSKGSLAVGIFIQPFMFEGQKRLEQANQLIDGLLECTDMLLVVDQDGLLRRDVVTVSEASSIAKNAVLLSIKAIMDLLAGKVEIFHGGTIEGSSATSDDTKKILQTAGRAWLGSGRGNTSIEAIEMAVAEAPTYDYHPFGASRLVLCTLASALDQSREEVGALKSFLHETLGPELQLVLCTVKNPMLENGVLLATIIIIKPHSQQVASSQFSDVTGDDYDMQPMSGIKTVDPNSGSQQSGCNSDISASNSSNLSSSWSPLVKASSSVSGATATPRGVVNADGSYSVNHEKFLSGIQMSRPTDESNSSPQKSKPAQSKRSLGKKSSARSYRSPTRPDVKTVDSKQVHSQALLANTASQKSRLAWEAGPSSDVAEAWAQARADARKPAQVTSALDVSLPVGVRLDAEQSLQTLSENFASTRLEVPEDKWIGTEAVPVDPDALPRNRMMDMGLEAVRDMYNVASALVMGRETLDGRKQSSLSQRAASMLESERSQKKLTPLVEMGFKNGIYRGRCQGGLPEGKGRLSFSDGSFYDGQWKQGKRAGSGAFYYTNGDMFQGSWKDDVMHGKGWMYYHVGDRLYANFWKGKADGEGRFYSAQGDVFFGQYRENWRHGEFLYTEASGVRWSEVWENGILKSRTPVDS